METVRRVAKVRVANQLLAEMMTVGWHSDGVTCIEGVPVGARFLGAYDDPSRRSSYFVFEHESFAEVPDCFETPEISVLFERRAEPSVDAAAPGGAEEDDGVSVEDEVRAREREQSVLDGDKDAGGRAAPLLGS